MSASGTSAASIVFVSDTTHAAKVVSTASFSAWTITGSYVQVRGFDITDTNSSAELGLYVEGSHDVMASNFIHDIRNQAGASCPGGGGGIDDGNYSATGNDEIGNTIARIGPSTCAYIHGIYHANAGGHIQNNIVVDVSGFGIHLWHADTGVVVSNNMVANAKQGGIVFGAGDAPGGVTTNNMVVTNNILYANGHYGIHDTGLLGANNVLSHNLFYANQSGAYSIGSGTGTISATLNADPQFMNYLPDGSGNYQLHSTSPALRAGTSLGAPSTDMLGNVRPTSQAPDVGPFEYGAAPVVSQPTVSPSPSATATPQPAAATTPTTAVASSTSTPTPPTPTPPPANPPAPQPVTTAVASSTSTPTPPTPTPPARPANPPTPPARPASPPAPQPANATKPSSAAGSGSPAAAAPTQPPASQSASAAAPALPAASRPATTMPDQGKASGGTDNSIGTSISQFVAGLLSKAGIPTGFASALTGAVAITRKKLRGVPRLNRQHHAVGWDHMESWTSGSSASHQSNMWNSARGTTGRWPNPPRGRG